MRMFFRAPMRLLLAAFAVSAAVCVAQSAPAPCSATNQTASKTCPPVTPDKPSAAPAPAQQFPFPGEQSKPANPGPNAPTPSAAADHPFPTESPDMPGEGSSSSSSSSNSSDAGDIPDATKPSATRRKLPRVKNLQTPDERVDEDLNVAKFYLGRENFKAAYLRSKDAVNTEPDYAETHYSLAVAAQKMKKLDEAKAEYNAYLKLEPDGDNAKAARKALAELQ